jgi:uncharacterized protein YoxC
MMPPETADNPSARITLDLRVPLWGVISASGAGLLLVAGLYFSVQALTEAVRELQITVKSGNTSVSVLSSETALLKFRVGTLEVDVQRINESLRGVKGQK